MYRLPTFLDNNVISVLEKKNENVYPLQAIGSMHDYAKNIILRLTSVFKSNQTLLFMTIFRLLESIINIYRVHVDLLNLKNWDPSSS